MNLSNEAVRQFLQFQSTGKGFDSLFDELQPPVKEMVRSRLRKRLVKGRFGGAARMRSKRPRSTCCADCASSLGPTWSSFSTSGLGGGWRATFSISSKLRRARAVSHPTTTLLLPSEQAGSHQHYFHLLLGNILPLFALPDDFRNGRDWMFCDPGPLSPLLLELGVEPVARERFRLLTRQLWSRSPSPACELRADSYRHLPPAAPMPVGGGVEAIRLNGYDAIRRDGVEAHDEEPTPGIHRAVRRVVERLEVRPPEKLDILLVDRGDPDPFYLSHAVIRGSGTSRRSIPNLATIGAALASIPAVRTRTVLLEGRSLSEQIAIFASARVVVAQHGAALANLVWCRPGTGVLEIAPGAGIERNPGLFARLSRGFGLRYVRLGQAGAHAAVPPETVAAAARSLLDVPP